MRGWNAPPVGYGFVKDARESMKTTAHRIAKGTGLGSREGLGEES